MSPRYRRVGTVALGEETGTPIYELVAPEGFVHYPPGARVLVDGRDEARVRACWPKGAFGHLAPHYTVNFIGGDQNVRVHYTRVGVVRKKAEKENA